MLAGLDTLYNVKERWTIDELLDAHELLDIKADAEAEAMQRAKQAAQG